MFPTGFGRLALGANEAATGFEPGHESRERHGAVTGGVGPSGGDAERVRRWRAAEAEGEREPPAGFHTTGNRPTLAVVEKRSCVTARVRAIDIVDVVAEVHMQDDGCRRVNVENALEQEVLEVGTDGPDTIVSVRDGRLARIEQCGEGLSSPDAFAIGHRIAQMNDERSVLALLRLGRDAAQ